MKKQTQTIEQKQKKENQLVFIEYEKPTANGHFMTIMDSYRNIIGRIHKNFDDDTRQYKYDAFNHEGNPLSSGINLGFIKNEFINNREELLEHAHQRRIASKEKSKQMSNEKSQGIQKTDRTDERKMEMEKLRGKTEKEKQNEKAFSNRMVNSDEKSSVNKAYENNDYNFDEEQILQEEREHELDDLRNDRDDDREDMNIDR